MTARTTSIHARAGRVTLVLALCVACGDSSDPLFGDPTFDDWCDNELCDWDRIGTGRIARVSTWHAKDTGVSFLDPSSQISQRLGGEPYPCFQLDTIADIDGASLEIRVDYNDDGIIDFRQQVADARWQSVTFPLPAPVDYDGATFSVRKEGAGRAVLAQLRVLPQDECSVGPLKLATMSVCSLDEVCQSGSCVDRRCSELPPALGSE